MRRADANPNPTEILALNQQDNDIFLDIFSDFYAKIVDALRNKKQKFNLKVKADILASKKSVNRQFESPNRKGTIVSMNTADFEYNNRGKGKKLERGAVGASIMSASSHDGESMSIARKTN